MPKQNTPEEHEEPPEKLSAKERSERVNLGLAISGALLEPGESRSFQEIALYCDCSKQAIEQLYRRAIRKAHRSMVRLGHKELDDMFDTNKDAE